jgi:hypothetical protein
MLGPVPTMGTRLSSGGIGAVRPTIRVCGAQVMHGVSKRTNARERRVRSGSEAMGNADRLEAGCIPVVDVLGGLS